MNTDYIRAMKLIENSRRMFESSTNISEVKDALKHFKTATGLIGEVERIDIGRDDAKTIVESIDRLFSDMERIINRGIDVGQNWFVRINKGIYLNEVTITGITTKTVEVSIASINGDSVVRLALDTDIEFIELLPVDMKDVL
jgi:hypothetical protein